MDEKNGPSATLQTVHKSNPRRKQWRWFSKNPTFPLRWVLSFYGVMATLELAKPEEYPGGIALAAVGFIMTVLTRNKLP